MTEANDDDLRPDDLEALRRESEIDDAKKRRDAFAEEAERRGLVYYEEKGYYIDENGNALDEYGERM